ncbi:MAG: hypothetical protein WCJ35_22720, partial [Planctomycetota bacterium]
MFDLKLSSLGVVAIFATLGSQNLVSGQLPPPAANVAAVPTPQFRTLTEADVQDALTQAKAAVAALDERFAAAGASADGWKDYLSWDKFKGELQKAKPEKAVVS